jgi:hypothetical protein
VVAPADPTAYHNVPPAVGNYSSPNALNESVELMRQKKLHSYYTTFDATATPFPASYDNVPSANGSCSSPEALNESFELMGMQKKLDSLREIRLETEFTATQRNSLFPSAEYFQEDLELPQCSSVTAS